MATFPAKFQAQEEFKRLIVTAMTNTKDFFNDIKYNNFMNSVEMLDCLMESYKKDPIFLDKASAILTIFKLNQEDIRGLEIIDINEASKMEFESKVKLYQSWFRLLVDLANRTVFAGRMLDVDIDLEKVFNTWKAMIKVEKETTPADIQKEAEEVSMPNPETEVSADVIEDEIIEIEEEPQSE